MADTNKTAKVAADKVAADKVSTDKVAAETVAAEKVAGKKMLGTATSVLSETASAYVAGVSAITKSVFGVGQEIAQETLEHGKSSMQATCVRSLAEMQAGYVQHRLESSTVHVKTVADVASESFKNVYAPLFGLLKDRNAA